MLVPDLTVPFYTTQYFRMLKVGVPKGNVKQKMRQDGLDPNVLDMDPNAPLPKPAGPPLKDDPQFKKVRACIHHHTGS